jgi:NAD(P)-dependent dehydrogenase (short-subunit alcohol dehydrogenase family)
MNSSFAGKALLITGGTFGIGFARAVTFAEQGGNIAVDWRREIEEADPFRLIDQVGSNRPGSES